MDCQLINEIIFEFHLMPLVVLFVLNVESTSYEVHAEFAVIFLSLEKGWLLLKQCVTTCLYQSFHFCSLDIYQIDCLGTRTNQEWKGVFVKAWHFADPILIIVTCVRVLDNSGNLPILN